MYMAGGNKNEAGQLIPLVSRRFWAFFMLVLDNQIDGH